MSELTADQINQMSAPQARHAIRALGLEPMQFSNGDLGAMKAHLLERIAPKPAADAAPPKAKRSRKPPTPQNGNGAEPTPEPQAQTTVAAPTIASTITVPRGELPAGFAEWQKMMELRIATLEQACGIGNGSSLPPLPDDKLLAEYLRVGPNQEQTLAIEVADLELMNEAQLHALARIIHVEVHGNMPVRVLRATIKPQLARMIGDSTAATETPAPPKGRNGAPAAPAFTPTDGALVIAVGEDGKTYDPCFVIGKHKKQWIVHLPTNEMEPMEPSQIKGPSSKPWKLDEWKMEDFEEGYWDEQE